MYKKRTRIWSILLVCTMLLAMLPTVALADGEWTVVSTAETLTNALSAGGNIKLTDNITVDTEQNWSITKDVVLDLNGSTITSTYSKMNNYIMVVNGAALTVTDSSKEKNGKIAVTDSSYGYGIQLRGTGSTFNLQGGTIETTQETVDIYDSAVNASITVSGGKLISSADSVLGVRGSSTTVNITGGELVSNGRTGVYISCYGDPDSIQFAMSGGTLTHTGGASGAIQMYKGATLTIGGTANITSSSYAVQVQENTILNVDGGTLTSTGTYVISSGNTSTVNITGGEIDGTKTAIRCEDTSTVNISGGKLTTGATSSSYPIIDKEGSSQVSITGGTFQTSSGASVSVDDYLPSGMTQDDHGAVVKDDTKAKVSVDGVWYATIQEAIAALHDNSVMVITSGDYDVTATRGEGTYGTGFIIDKDNVTIKAANPENKPVIYGFTNKYSAGTDDGGINGQDTIYVSGSGVTLENLIIMPLGGYKDNNGTGVTFATKTVEVTSTATGFTMTGCETTPNTKAKDGNVLDNAEMTKSGNIHVSINDATISGNSFGTGTTISAGWKGNSAADTYSVDVSDNYWGADATVATIANAIDGNVKVVSYYTDESMSASATIGGIPVASSEQLTDAITSAKNGDTIIVAPGSYGGNITFGGKSLTIKAQYPAYKDGVREDDETKLSNFTGTFNTSEGTDATAFDADQKIVIEGFALSGDGLKIGNTHYSTVGTLEVRNCTMEFGQNLTNEGQNRYQLNYFVKNSSVGKATVVVEDNYISGEPVENVYPLQLWGVQSATVRNNVFDLTGAASHQAIGVSKMATDAIVEITGNTVNGAGGGIYVTTWLLGGEDENAQAVFTGSITVEDNKLECAESETMDPIFLGYEEAAGENNPYGLLAGTLNVSGNTNKGSAVEAVIVRGPETETAALITATFMDGNVLISTYTSAPAEDAATITVLIPEGLAKTNYTFKGWSDGSKTYQPGEEVTISADTTFTAQWSYNPPYIPSTPTTPVDTFPFTDVSENQWYYTAVKYVYANDLMDGVSETLFAPTTELNRAMVAQILYNMEGNPNGGVSIFTDLKAGYWYVSAVNWAAAEGIVSGYPDGTFKPEGSVTRQELALMLYKYAEYKGYDLSAKNNLSAFVDGAETADWALAAMQWAVGEGLLSGKGAGVLDPTGTATRAEVAQIFMQLCENVAK